MQHLATAVPNNSEILFFLKHEIFIDYCDLNITLLTISRILRHFELAKSASSREL